MKRVFSWSGVESWTIELFMFEAIIFDFPVPIHWFGNLNIAIIDQY